MFWICARSDFQSQLQLSAVHLEHGRAAGQPRTVQKHSAAETRARAGNVSVLAAQAALSGQPDGAEAAYTGAQQHRFVLIAVLANSRSKYSLIRQPAQSRSADSRRKMGRHVRVCRSAVRIFHVLIK